jgi:hypothetical protein
MSSHFLPCQSTWVHTSFPVRAHEFTLLTLSEHISSVFSPCQSTWVHTSYPVRAHGFTLLTLSEHMSSHFSHCQRTWVHTSYSVPAHKFTLLTLLEHMSSHFLPCQNRWVHTSHPVRAHEFTPGFKWGSCYSVISFQCNVLYIVVCTFSFGHCVVCPSLIYGYWLLLWYVQALRYSVYTKKNLR